MSAYSFQVTAATGNINTHKYMPPEALYGEQVQDKQMLRNARQIALVVEGKMSKETTVFPSGKQLLAGLSQTGKAKDK